MNHHRQGSGPPLVLIHGIGQHWQAWRGAIPILARDFEVIACDSPGFGHSPPLPAGVRPTIPAYADAFAAFLRGAGLERPHVAGNSMGGAIVLELARRRLVASVTAISPAGFWSDAERRFCQTSLRPITRTPRAMRPVVEAIARTTLGRRLLFSQQLIRASALAPDDAVADLRAAWDAPAFAAALDAFDDYDFTPSDELRELPLTIAWGYRDRLLLYRPQSARARRLVPWARHVTLGGAHLPYIDDPAATAEVIRSTAQRTG